MVFNTAFCFVLATIALLIPERFFNFRKAAHLGISLFLILFCSLNILQPILNTSLGFDEFFVRVLVNDGSTNPGRMSPQTSFCFIMFGLFLIFNNFISSKRGLYLSLAVTICLFIVGFVCFLGYLLKFDLMYNWPKFGRMSLQTAMSFMILASALGLLWHNKALIQTNDFKDHDVMVNVTLISLLTVMLMIGGIAGIILWDKLTRNYYHESPAINHKV
ncbi:MAG: hypothetical protein JSR17_00430 [Proteobacteria bacterium]|nr:hypothetical protein [Pseudomonadota bacterium]